MTASRFPLHRQARAIRSGTILLWMGAALAVIAGLVFAGAAWAQSAEEWDLINEINALRASKGLAPYIVDPGLMAMAQEHSAYQASIHQSTHLHSDGRNPPKLGVVENVAGGDVGYLTPQAAVYDIWDDPGHMRTMVGFASGSMGVGIADDGTTAYYTLEVRPGGSGTKTSTPPKGGTLPTASTPIALIPLVTMTARADGTIFHEVGYGQTLWSIAMAYGVRVEQLQAWNNLLEGSTEIYAGQKLLVRPASLVTLLPTESPAAGSPVPAVTVTVTPQPATLTPESVVSAADAARQTVPPNEVETSAPEQPGSSLLLVIAGGSIAVGCALLVLLLLVRRKP